MKILLTTIGSSGDINPFIAIARELQKREHEVRLAVNPYFQDVVERAGVTFEAFGEHLSPVEFAKENPAAFGRVTGAWALFRGFIFPRVKEMHDRLDELANEFQPEAMVGHQISFGLPWVAQRADIPWATCALAPATVLSAHDPSRMPVGMDLSKMPMWYRRAAQWAVRGIVSLSFDGGFNRVRRELGLPKRRDTLFGEMLSGDAVLGMWSLSWRASAPDDPPAMRICGFPWFDGLVEDGVDDVNRLDPALRVFLDGGDPPIVFTFGSVLSHTGDDAYAEAVRACESLGRRGVLITGNEDAAPPELPSSIHRADFAPYGALFPRASAVVHHGGVGTTAQGLRAGVPTVILPHAHDQFDNADRCARHGVSRTLRRHRIRAKDLANALGELLADEEATRRARDLGERIRVEDGAREAAIEIERIARREAP